MIYFVFTTLSTQGYGDFVAVSNGERVVMCFILLFGVGLFSFVLQNFIDMLMSFRVMTSDNEEQEKLAKWLGLLARFNKGRPLPKDLVKKIEEYFEYYWSKDKNYALKYDEDRLFLKELPKNIRTNIYKDFLFQDFYYLFKTFFQIPKDM